jgi:hypothetical protein
MIRNPLQAHGIYVFLALIFHIAWPIACAALAGPLAESANDR